ncbi:hypothetical protein C3709_22245 [Lelliottia aquatilis]|uniref:Lipoprotein n=1 Tax=Lelliottia aquatilis TaxID=2080838 RepID=A0ABX4ZVL2_9ENTR|nr:hypothetical protein C3Z09_21380 [Lelliottia aquatilis]POZ15211.1 hypothetical protein C3708_22495 [Lelliottia sp. 7254-16]POZ18950.1 hypothetical protein C3712_22340 [Lelliottia aquatilis]POZ20518.1 hypothetical protein C3711_22545 [Lelliottia aquatilis]POZ30557.1 hypothetical protein C3710_22120 [Lelliottia aquatilis]
MKAVTGVAGVLLTLLLAGCSALRPAPVPPTVVIPTTLLEQLGEQVSWLRAGACHGDPVATRRLSRALDGGGMAAGDFAWLRGDARGPLTESGLLGGSSVQRPAGLLMLTCGGHAAA